MKRVVGVVLCICMWSGVLAQDWAKPGVPAKDENLKVGDKLPFAVVHNMINYSRKDLDLGDHRPKLTLFDFWFTKCGPCVAAWPKLLELQQEFGKDLQIVLINQYEKEQVIKDFIAKRKKMYNVEMNLPISASDSTIRKYFRLPSMPRYFWIDSNNTIRAITHGSELTRENIKKWIASGPVPLKQLVDTTWQSVRYFDPIFVNGNGGARPDAFIWTSSLTKGQIDNPASSNIFYDQMTGYGIALTNSSILGLYATAYNNRLLDEEVFDYLPTSRRELHAKDTARFYDRRSSGGATYNYQIISGVPKSHQELVAMMKEDLKRYFGMNVSWEKRKKKCLVFTMSDSSLVRGKSRGAEIAIKSGEMVLDSVNMHAVITEMEMSTRYRSSPYPFVDETGYKGWITGIRAEGNALDPVEFDKMLSKFGMHLKLEMRDVDVLVLREPRITP